MNNYGSRNATCKVCPKNCSWRDHVCTSYRFETYQEMETRTIDQLKAKYDSAMTIKDEVETVMMKMEKELEEVHRVSYK